MIHKKTLPTRLATGCHAAWQHIQTTRLGFFWLLVGTFWLKTVVAYAIVFWRGLSPSTPVQFGLLLVNPVGFTILLLSLALLIRPRVLYYWGIVILDVIASLLLYLNVLYFREFSDFVSVNTMLGYSSMNQGGKGINAVPTSIFDVFFWVDILLIIGLLVFRRIQFSPVYLGRVLSFRLATLGFGLVVLNLFVADIERPQLLTRQFDRSYVVRYLGLGPFTIYDGVNTYLTNRVRQSATAQDLAEVHNFTKQQYAPANSAYWGLAKNKNVLIIHLESFQQFTLNRKLGDQEITPNLNKIIADKDTISFDNFYHQVGQGKTSDAENMLETSTFGLPQGSLFASLGEDQDFQAMPAILNQQQGYSSAVFHGNKGTFWKRNLVYKRMGYQNFFDQAYYQDTPDRLTDWGIKDKLLFHDSVPYLEKLQQPFYAKYLTVSNHTPYTISDNDKSSDFESVAATASSSPTINNFFTTNHYMDQSIGEFFDYLKKSGLYDNTMIVMYGDHFGISNEENKHLAPILGKDPNQWTPLDDANLQRVPFIVHIPNCNKGTVNHTYGGEIDVAPTLEHLLGINSKEYIQFGQDLFSNKHQQLVTFRNKDFVTPEYSYLMNKVWDNATGQVVSQPNAALTAQVAKDKQLSDMRLALSDQLNQKNLLRFYQPRNFTTVNSRDYNYDKSATLARLDEQEAALGKKSRSLYDQNGHQSTLSQYQTNAPELAP